MAPAIAVGAWNMHVDRIAVGIHGALRAQGVRAMLLKGAATATWLYDDEASVRYGDVDLLVSPDQFGVAEQVLAGMGFALVRAGLSPREETSHARAWVRDADVVDVHHRLWGVGAEPRLAWLALTDDAETLQLCGGEVEALAIHARALHLALHSAQHGLRETKPRLDLGRAASRVPLDTWKRAAELARALDAEGAMYAGLRLQPATAHLADRLGLSARVSPTVALHASDAPACALAFAATLDTPGAKAKLALAARRIFPTKAWMRGRYPSAARGPGGLAAAYVRRTASLARQAPAALAAVRRARSANTRSPTRPIS